MYKFRHSFLKSFILLDLTIVVILVAWYTVRVIQLHNYLIDEEFELAYNEVNEKFTSNLNTIKSILNNVSQNIHQETKLEQISHLFSEFDSKIKAEIKELISWNTLTWVDKDRYMRANSAKGILMPPYRIELNDFTNECRQQTNSLKIGYTSRSPNLKRLILPLCWGVADNKVYIGTITTSFDIERFTRRLLSRIKNPAVSFAVVSPENIIAIESPDYFISDYILDLVSTITHYENSPFYIEKRLLNFIKGSSKVLIRDSDYNFKIIVASNDNMGSSNLYKAITHSFFDLSFIATLIFMLTIFVYRQLVKPILELSSYAVIITAGNDAGEIKNYKYNELKVLANAVRNVLYQQKELVEANIKLEQLVKEKAEIANKAKSDFIRNIQHELKTPLNHILGSVDILNNEIIGPKLSDYKEYINIINLAGRELLETINNLILAAELATGKAKLNKRLISVRELIEFAGEEVQRKVSSKKLLIKEDIEPKLPLIFGDLNQMRKALICVLNNSIAFSKENDTININAHKSDSTVIIDIIDNGPGIKDKDLAKITEMFEYTEEILTKTNRGLGIGLSIVRNILDLHSIQLEIKSEINRGTQVRFIIPIPEIYKQ